MDYTKYLIDDDECNIIFDNMTQSHNNEFLIYRHIEQKDVGWYMLRQFSSSKKKKLFDFIIDDEIICYFGKTEDIDNITIYITKTTIDYQLKHNFKPQQIFDKVLCNSEKIHINEYMTHNMPIPE